MINFNGIKNMKKTRRKFTAAFKTQVVLEAIKERRTLTELAKRFEVHPNQISTWKKEFLDNADKAFDSPQKSKNKDVIDVSKLYEKIGVLEMERDFLKKNLNRIGR